MAPIIDNIFSDDMVKRFDENDALCVIDKIGFGETLDQIKREFNTHDFEEIHHLPVYYSMINNSLRNKFIMTEEVKASLDTILQPITENETGLEYPFFLLGNKKEDGNEEYVEISEFMTAGSPNSSISTSYEKEAVEELEEKLRSGKYDVVIAGHTHPDVSKESIINDTMPENVRNLYSSIDRLREFYGEHRGGGLSLQDVLAQIIFTSRFKEDFPTVTSYGAIYDYEGQFDIYSYQYKTIYIAENILYEDNNQLHRQKNAYSEKEKQK